MLRLRFIIKELFRNFYRHPGTLLGSFLSLALIFFLFDLFWVGAGTANRVYSGLLTQVRMETLIDESVPDSSLAPLASSVNDVPGVAGVRFVSKDEAREELARMVGTDLLVGYDTLNPLPRSFVLTLDPAAVNSSSMTSIESALHKLPGIADVLYSRTWLAKAEATQSLIRKLGFGLGVIILLTAVIISANSIRLMTRARSTGVRQLLLLGAGRLFISLPFLIEGFLIGGLAAVAGWGVILYGYTSVEITQFEVVMPPGAQIAVFCCGTALLGLLSGLLGLYRLFR